MKFSEHLAAHLTPEWRKQYIRYEALKDLLYQATENAPQPDDYGEQQISRYFAKFEEKFFQYCEKELSKINTFFYEKEAEAARTFAQLQDELRQVEAPSRPRSMQEKLRRKSSFFFLSEFQDSEQRETFKSNKRKIADLKLAFTEFYLSLVLIQNYQNLNFTGFRKILKKHDKMMQNNKGADFRCTRVERATFYISKQIDDMIVETEMLFTNNLADGDRQRAMNKLRVPPLVAKHTNWTTFFVGLYSGFFILLLCLMASGLIVSYIYSTGDEPYRLIGQNSTDFQNCTELDLSWANLPMKVDCAGHREEWRPALRMYRGMFLLIFIIFLLGINTYGWRKAGVNHVLIFELDPRNNLSHEELLEVALFFGVLWAISVLSFMVCYWLNSWSYVNPLALAVFMLVFLLNPTRTLKYRARFWLIKILSHIIIAPLHPVGFADFWLADQLNSLVTVLLDFEFLICFYTCEVLWVGNSSLSMVFLTGNVSCNTYGYVVRAIVASLPAWFRFAQCVRRYYDSRLAFPHLVNAGKYSTTFFVVVFSSLCAEMKYETRWENPFQYLWLISVFASSCYTLTWDIKMDWGLLEGRPPNRFLREEVIYTEIVYYLAVVEDFILRFAWTIAMSFSLTGVMDQDIAVSIFAGLEVFRRFVWNFFRLENEHLNNCGQFRAVRDISIKPTKSDQNNPVKVERMMDDESKIPLSKHKMSWERRKRIENLCEALHIPDGHLSMQTFKEDQPSTTPQQRSSVTFFLGDEEPSSTGTRQRKKGLNHEDIRYRHLTRTDSEASDQRIDDRDEEESDEEDSL
ncbi:Xenotropic and polytropic retrovirus receptor 1-like [Holothuria leucospilota]|uniref:Xenotropic and polytropic retrovirus receptor 1-like n=1 Tax=Holothuria leucospilota TaxID=206669 RepID=A0A9Q1HAZ9_HOLLE|nr:Xenotropic and polytropic retrovirus receptor 1-like [Holothuria leucospilota]